MVDVRYVLVSLLGPALHLATWFVSAVRLVGTALVVTVFGLPLVVFLPVLGPSVFRLLMFPFPPLISVGLVPSEFSMEWPQAALMRGMPSIILVSERAHPCIKLARATIKMSSG